VDWITAHWPYVGAIAAALTILNGFLTFLKLLEENRVIARGALRQIIFATGAILKVVNSFLMLVWSFFKLVLKVALAALILSSVISFGLQLSGEKDFVVLYARLIAEKLKPLPTPTENCARYERRILPPRCTDLGDPLMELSCRAQLPETRDICVEYRK
jgi:hypothetical protein